MCGWGGGGGGGGGAQTYESYAPLIMFLQDSFCPVGVIHCKWIKDADMVVIEIWVNCFVCDLLNQSRLWMVHQMWEAHFETTYQNKGNLLIWFPKVHTKWRKIFPFVRSFFYQTRKNPYTTLCLSIYLFVLQLYIVHAEKTVLSYFLS